MSKEELDIIILTIKVALTSTIIVFPVSLYIGWVLARKKIRCKAILEALISLPLVAPPVVTGYTLLLLLGKNSYIGSYLYNTFNIKLSFNFAALVIASSIVSLPIAVRSIRSAFELINPSYENTSLTLGASKISTFFRVSLPMAFSGILSAMILTFARSLGEFGATITLAGNIIGKTRTISLMIYSNMQVPGKENEVLRLMFISISIYFLDIIISEMINKKRAYVK